MAEASKEKVCLKKQLTKTENGHFQLEGFCGDERIAVVLDPTVYAELPEEGREAAILAMHGEIQAAATRRYGIGGAYPVYRPYSTILKHHLIALTDADLKE